MTLRSSDDSSSDAACSFLTMHAARAGMSSFISDVLVLYAMLCCLRASNPSSTGTTIFQFNKHEISARFACCSQAVIQYEAKNVIHQVDGAERAMLNAFASAVRSTTITLVSIRLCFVAEQVSTADTVSDSRSPLALISRNFCSYRQFVSFKTRP